MLFLSLGLFSGGFVNTDLVNGWVSASCSFKPASVPLGSVVTTGKAGAPISQAQHKLQAPELCVASKPGFYHQSDLEK